MKRVIKVIDWLSSIGGGIAGVTVYILCMLIFLSIFTRYVFNRPMGFTEELTGYLMVGIIFFGLAYTLRHGGHIRVSAIIDRLNPRMRATLGLIMTVVALGWAVPFLLGCLYVWRRHFAEKMLSYGMLEVPMWIPSLIMVIGAAFLLLQIVAEILKSTLLRRHQ